MLVSFLANAISPPHFSHCGFEAFGPLALVESTQNKVAAHSDSETVVVKCETFIDRHLGLKILVERS